MTALAGPADLAVLTATCVVFGVPVLRWLRRPAPWSHSMRALGRSSERSAR